MMQFNEHDTQRLITACEVYKDQTGSEYMWDEYDHLIHKLKNYAMEYECPGCWDPNSTCEVHS